MKLYLWTLKLEFHRTFPYQEIHSSFEFLSIHLKMYELGFPWWLCGKEFTCQCRNSVQSLSHVRLLATPWTTACQASLSITSSQSPPKPMSIDLVMPSSRLILCRPLLLLPSIPPSIRVFSNESALCMRWPKYWSFSFNISPSSEHPGLTLV